MSKMIIYYTIQSRKSIDRLVKYQGNAVAGRIRIDAAIRNLRKMVSPKFREIVSCG
ncbi:MAG: hypothetical protein AB1611_00965 [bacterium]